MSVEPISGPDSAAPPLVAVLAYRGLCTFEFAIAVEVFATPRPELPRRLYRFAAVAVENGPLEAAGGLTVAAPYDLTVLADAHTIVVPGWRGSDAPVPQALIDALRAAHGRGARLVSICSGAFVLARAGLLSGRRAVTHWKYLDALAGLDSTIRIEADALYVDDGAILTSAGSAAGLDLCLHLVRQDHGAAVANSVARRLVLPAHREGGQSQFVPAPMGTGRGGVAPLLDRIRGQLDRPWSVERMAEAASTSPRTLLRRFTEATGLSPKQWLLEQRLQQARDLLESTRDSIEQVAGATGLRSPESLRHHFRRRYGVSPSAYRAAFGRPKPGASARTGVPNS